MNLFHSTHSKERQQPWSSQLEELQRLKEKSKNAIEETSKGGGKVLYGMASEIKKWCSHIKGTFKNNIWIFLKNPIPFLK